MKILMTLLPMIFLISCATGCKRKIVCTDIKRATIKPLAWCDISFKPTPRCRCRCFDMNKNKTVADSKCDTNEEVFKSGNYPIQECDQIGGPTIKDWATHVRPNIKRLQSIKQTYCK